MNHPDDPLETNVMLIPDDWLPPALPILQPWGALLLGTDPMVQEGHTGPKSMEQRTWFPEIAGKTYNGPVILFSSERLDKASFKNILDVQNDHLYISPPHSNLLPHGKKGNLILIFVLSVSSVVLWRKRGVLFNSYIHVRDMSMYHDGFNILIELCFKASNYFIFLPKAFTNHIGTYFLAPVEKVPVPF